MKATGSQELKLSRHEVPKYKVEGTVRVLDKNRNVRKEMRITGDIPPKDSPKPKEADKNAD
jgi:hypothetical protein